MNIVVFADRLSQQLLHHACFLQSMTAMPVGLLPPPTSAGSPERGTKRYRKLTAEERETLRIKDGRRNVIQVANTSPVKRLRLSDEFHEHQSLSASGSKTARCVLCGTNTKVKCRLCNVALHRQIKVSTTQRRSCWDQWHRNETVKRRHLQKKPKQHN
jgi:hypothetical protein